MNDRQRRDQWRGVWTFLAWGLVIANLMPILWMIWCSFMSNNEILQGKLAPAPRSNDAMLVRRTPQELQAFTVNGEMYAWNHLDSAQARYRNLGALASDYYEKGDSLWVFSSNKALQLISLRDFSTHQSWDWDFFRESYHKEDQTSFLRKPGYLSMSDVKNLAIRLNQEEMGNSGQTLGSLTGITFAEDLAILDQLNEMLQNPELRGKVISLLNSMRWESPLANYLLRKDELTELEEKRLVRSMIAEVYPHTLTRFEVVSWESIWVDRIPANGNGTSLTEQAGALCMGVWWEDFPGVAIFEPQTGKTNWITMRHGLPNAAVQHLLPLGETLLLVVTDAGLSVIDVPARQLIRNYMFGDFGLPYLDGRALEVVHTEEFQILISYGQGVMLFDAGRIQTKVMETGFLEKISSDISALAYDGQDVFIGTGEGMFQLPFQAWLDSTEVSSESIPVTHYTNLFLQNDTDSLGNGLIHYVGFDGRDMLLGGIFGHVSIVDKDTRQVVSAQNLPRGGYYPHWRNYVDLWRTIPFSTFLWNSIVICFSVMVISMLIASLAGYALARYRFPGRGFFGKSVLASQMIPAILYIIPIFIFFTALYDFTGVRLVNSRLGLILTYTAFFTPMSIWILRGFFIGVPKELEEAALIDGCGHFGAFIRVVIPAALPGMVATGIYIFLLAWDELMFAWVLSTDLSTATIPVGIRLYVGQFGNRFDLLMAASTVATLPAMLLFFLMQRNIVTGLTGGAVKG